MFEKIYGKRSAKNTDDGISKPNVNNKDLKKMARTAGFMYLALILTGIIAQVIRMTFIVPGDAAQTANNLMGNGTLFAGANVLWIISEIFFVFLGIALYKVLKPVNKNLALIMLLIIVVGAVIECINTLNNFAALQLLNSAEMSSIFTTEQLHAQVMSYLHSWEAGYAIPAVLSFGPWLIVAGYLVYNSAYFPKMLGILVFLAGFSIFIEGMQTLLGSHILVIAIVTGLISVIGEFTFCGWLVAKGAKVQPPTNEEDSKIKTTESTTKEGSNNEIANHM